MRGATSCPAGRAGKAVRSQAEPGNEDNQAPALPTVITNGAVASTFTLLNLARARTVDVCSPGGAFLSIVRASWPLVWPFSMLKLFPAKPGTPAGGSKLMSTLSSKPYNFFNCGSCFSVGRNVYDNKA